MTDQQTTDEEQKERPADLAEFLLTVRPATNIEAAEKLAKVVEAVRSTGKGGSLTLKISVAPVKDADADVLEIVDKVTTIIPERTRKHSLAYPDSDNRLSRMPPETVVLFTDESIRQLPAAPANTEIKRLPNT